MPEAPTELDTTGTQEAPAPPTLLVITDSDDGLALVATLLARLAPHCLILTARDSETALRILRKSQVHLVFGHRTDDLDELPLLETIRPQTSAPIVALSFEANFEKALAAGATRVFSSDQWHHAAVVASALLTATHALRKQTRSPCPSALPPS